MGASGGLDAVRFAIHEIRAAAAVYVQIDKAGQNVSAVYGDGFRVRGRGLIDLGDAAVFNQNGAVFADAIRQYDISVSNPDFAEISVHK